MRYTPETMKGDSSHINTARCQFVRTDKRN